MKVFVVIPAAGLGTRMAAAGKKAPATSKQFLEIGGTPVLFHTLRKFASVPAISGIVLALRESEVAGLKSRIENEPDAAQLSALIRYVVGGETRQESVANGLAALIHSGTCADDDLVLVHDAVRPFVDARIIADVIAAAVEHGAAIAGLPAVDTIKQVERTPDGAMIHATIPREKVVLAQTPQGFRCGLLRQAFATAQADGFLGTDEASVVEHLGHEVAVVMGSPRNIKITQPSDLALAEFYLER